MKAKYFNYITGQWEEVDLQTGSTMSNPPPLKKEKKAEFPEGTEILEGEIVDK